MLFSAVNYSRLLFIARKIINFRSNRKYREAQHQKRVISSKGRKASPRLHPRSLVGYIKTMCKTLSRIARSRAQKRPLWRVGTGPKNRDINNPSGCEGSKPRPGDFSLKFGKMRGAHPEREVVDAEAEADLMLCHLSDVWFWLEPFSTDKMCAQEFWISFHFCLRASTSWWEKRHSGHEYRVAIFTNIEFAQHYPLLWTRSE